MKSYSFGKFFRISLALIIFLAFNCLFIESSSAARKKGNYESIKMARENLNNTAWQVRFKPIGDRKKKREFNDELNFTDNKFESMRMSRQGFYATHFSVNFNKDGNIVWETIQSGPGNNLALWKGEIAGANIWGVLSLRKGGPPVEYNFIGTKK